MAAVCVAAASAQETVHTQPLPPLESPAATVPQEAGAHYDWARVVRVVRVPGGGGSSYQGEAGQHCYRRDAGGSFEREYYRPGQPVSTPPVQGGSETGRYIATAVGGLLGAVIGSRMGGGDGRYITSGIGSMVGGMAGSTVYDTWQRERQRGQVTVCDPVPVDGSTPHYGNGPLPDAYDVTYEYAGRQYTRRMAVHPGEQVRVRVDVSPE